MAESKGWIKTYRKIQDCWIWQIDKPFDERSAWIDLLLTANHKDVKMLFNGELITIKRGQLITSVRKLSDKWQWDKNKTLKFLRLLENDGMLVRESDNHRTLLAIVNYEIYQDCTDTDETQKQTHLHTQPPHTYATNKNDKNDKNEKEDNTHAREDEIYALAFSDVEKVWKDTYKVYPKQSYSHSAKIAWLDLFKGVSASNQLDVAKMIVHAIRLYLDDYKKQNPDDDTFRYVPRFDTWLKEDCMHWIGVYEEKVRGK